jgi:thiazole/oxazole-forming peptide maturase SagD family component
MMDRWYASRFTGLFTHLASIPLRPHDPPVPLWAGRFVSWGPTPKSLSAGGAGWDPASAEAACVGEAIERLMPAPLPADQAIEARFDAWPLDEPAIPPERWILFHPEQYAQPGFPLAPFTRSTLCRWVCFRQAGTGLPWWVPEELAFLEVRSGDRHRICPAVSTGLSCGRLGHPVLLRGLQEVIERDALVGAWWGRYRLEEWPAERVFAALDSSLPPRLLRPNLRYRCYRVESPISDHVTMVTLEGEDREGWCFSIGSACRESRQESWLKSLLEAVQGRHYVRYLLTERSSARELCDFPAHAVYYSLHREQLAKTVLHRARPPSTDTDGEEESLSVLSERLGSNRPVLFRNLTPPGIAQEIRDWVVLKVLVPGLQPLHGDDYFAHLGGPLWAPRGLGDWAGVPPHPFP